MNQTLNKLTVIEIITKVEAPLSLKNDFVDELINLAKDTSEENGISEIEALKVNINYYFDCSNADFKRNNAKTPMKHNSNWINALTEHAKGLAFGLPFEHDDIMNDYGYSDASDYWETLGLLVFTLGSNVHMLDMPYHVLNVSSWVEVAVDDNEIDNDTFKMGKLKMIALYDDELKFNGIGLYNA